jgi:hypothetical protein
MCQESDRAADPTRSLPARSPTCSPASSTATLIAKSLPVIHELDGTCVCVSLAITIQSRNVRDFSTSLDQVSRLRREGITTDKRSRALSQVLEETARYIPVPANVTCTYRVPAGFRP